MKEKKRVLLTLAGTSIIIGLLIGIGLWFSGGSNEVKEDEEKTHEGGSSLGDKGEIDREGVEEDYEIVSTLN